jgi:hypothetical protein
MVRHGFLKRVMQREFPPFWGVVYLMRILCRKQTIVSVRGLPETWKTEDFLLEPVSNTVFDGELMKEVCLKVMLLGWFRIHILYQLIGHPHAKVRDYHPE